MKVIIKIIFMCYVMIGCMIGNVNASSSCEPRMSFLGFSQDWKTVYWEEHLSGECAIDDFSIHAYDITSDFPFRLFSPESMNKIIEVDDDLVSDEDKIEDEELERIRKKHYTSMKLALKKTLILPIEGRWIDESASITGSKPMVKKECDQPDNPDYTEKCNFTISRQNKRCNEQLVYQDMERYLRPMKNVKSVHHNPEYDVVVLISEHCNITDPLCHPDNAIQIIKLTDC